mmetsp:Transcript_17663/g.51959  ORF Transcript_17663/g.51959 Transcript_17663/m.51959 type:complete len:224 (+) Transcript_17663:1459-2130(+)
MFARSACSASLRNATIPSSVSPPKLLTASSSIFCSVSCNAFACCCAFVAASAAAILTCAGAAAASAWAASRAAASPMLVTACSTAGSRRKRASPPLFSPSRFLFGGATTLRSLESTRPISLMARGRRWKSWLTAHPSGVRSTRASSAAEILSCPESVVFSPSAKRTSATSSVDTSRHVAAAPDLGFSPTRSCAILPLVRRSLSFASAFLTNSLSSSGELGSSV